MKKKFLILKIFILLALSVYFILNIKKIVNTFLGWGTNTLNLNAGLSVILLAIFVKLLLMPLTQKDNFNDKKKKIIESQIKNVKEKYDKETGKKKIKDIYQYYEINSFSITGCISSIFQLIITIGIFQSIRGSSIFSNVTFLGLNLDERSPYFILPILIVFIMGMNFYQTDVRPNKKSAILFLVILILIFSAIIFVPNALLLYWLTNSIFTLFQNILALQSAKKYVSSKSEFFSSRAINNNNS
ncbi:membrane protein insertase YidC [Lysinibacillus sp. FSL K6-0102]|uniref:membrane protein insertase YidC n=1 Tax=Lysinibacillus sp. FSL K6-0102 TaxID=2975290 RepID=UPI0030F5F94B